MYYDENRTMESIANTLGVSRSTVSRLLRDARTEGLVRISLHAPQTHRPQELTRAVELRYGVRTVIAPSAPSATERERLQAVAEIGALELETMVQPGTAVGVAWGTTVAALSTRLRHRPTPGVSVVQLNGAISTEGSSDTYVSAVLAQAAGRWDATVEHFPVPAFFDFPATREAMWRERSVRRVLEAQSRCSLAVFGVGAFDADVPSQAYTSSYLTAEDRSALQSDGAVGDVCTVFLRADGSWRGIGMNTRVSGPDPQRLGMIPRRLLIAAGSRKAVPLRAALCAGVATDLVVDEVTAAGLLALD